MLSCACVRTLLAIALTLGACRSAASEQPANDREPVSEVMGQVLGAEVDGRITLLLFVMPDCPIANAYVPAMNRLAADYARRDVVVRCVYADPEIDLQGIEAHRAAWSLAVEPVFDPSMALARELGVTRSPEAALLDARGELVYRGRIDDWYSDYGQMRPRATRHELREALEALLAGRTPPVTRTQAVGCLLALDPR
jgi:hypothetical protein